MPHANKKKRRGPIFRAWIIVNGEKLWAKDYGHKAWPISARRRRW